MIPERYRDFYGDQTRWFVGTVVSNNDPLELGRIRVRIYGIHSDNKTDIPDADLPWSQVIIPVTQGGTKGYGNNLGIQRGAEVFGIFLDGQSSQMPLVLGSMPKYENTTNNTVTTNLLARSDLGSKHPSYLRRLKGRVNDEGEAIEYYVARPPKVTSVAPDKTSPTNYYDNKYWIEPYPADGKLSEYPDNHVYETPAGHVMEFDNGPGKERFHHFHPSGSYEEIIATGQKTLKITGPNYELYLDSSSIFIKGDHNVTISGNKRELIQGNYHLEVEGDMTMNLHQSLQTKIAFNQETEVGKFRVTNVGEDDNLTVLAGDQNLNINAGSRIENIKTNDIRTVVGDIKSYNYGSQRIFTRGALTLATVGTLTMSSDNTITLETSGAMNMDIDGAKTETIGGTHTVTSPTAALTYTNGTITVTSGDVVASTISLNSHVHSGVTAGIANTGGPV